MAVLPALGETTRRWRQLTRRSARQANEKGLVTMHSILMLLYAVGVVLSAAALALALGTLGHRPGRHI